MIKFPVVMASLAEHDARPCFAFDINGDVIVYVNPSFNALFAGPIPGLRGLFDLIHQDDRACVMQAFLDMVPGSFKKDIEFRTQAGGRNRRWYRCSLLLKDQDGKRLLLGFLEDITALNELSSNTNEVLDIISHDLAGPFASMQALSMILAKKLSGTDDDDINKLITSMLRVCRKGSALLKEFMKHEFAASAGRGLVKKPANLVEKFRNLVSEYQQIQEETGKAFLFSCSHPAIYAAIDEQKFIRAITNLISNALKFTPNGGTITLSLGEENDSVSISLSDTGIGIPKCFHKNLFEKFNRARRHGLNGEPSIGLGMSIVKTIVNWHDGRIWFDSEEGSGTTFYIEIPKCAPIKKEAERPAT